MSNLMKTAIAFETDSGERIELKGFTGNCNSPVKKIIFNDGSWSWGKSWWFSHTQPKDRANQMYQIGAGAYGDDIVWKHELPII